MRIVCVICTEIFVSNSRISAINCGHIFHEDCLGKWLDNGQKTCPQCRFSANSKTIIKKLYLTENQDHSRLNLGDDNIKSTQFQHQYEDLLNQIESLKDELKQNSLTLKSKNELLEQKEKKLKELETNYANVKKTLSERHMIIDYMKKEMQSFKTVKEDIEEKERKLKEYEMKMTEYRCVDMIYQDHKGAFENEMRKYNLNAEKGADLQFAQQLIRCNVLLKEHSDKLTEEKRLIRKKLLQVEKQLSEKERLIESNECELVKLRERCMKYEETHKEDQEEIKKLEKRLNTLKSSIGSPTGENRTYLKRLINESPMPTSLNDATNIDESSLIVDTTITIEPTLNDDDLISSSVTTKATTSTATTTLESLDLTLSPLMTLNNKKRKNPFAKFYSNDENESNKQIKLTDLSTIAANTKTETNAKATTLKSNEILIDDSDDTDVFVVKRIEQVNAKNQQQPSKSTTSNGFSYAFDGFGGRKKVFNSITTTTTHNNNQKPLNNNNLSKSKVTKSPFMFKK